MATGSDAVGKEVDAGKGSTLLYERFIFSHDIIGPKFMFRHAHHRLLRPTRTVTFDACIQMGSADTLAGQAAGLDILRSPKHEWEAFRRQYYRDHPRQYSVAWFTTRDEVGRRTLRRAAHSFSVAALKFIRDTYDADSEGERGGSTLMWCQPPLVMTYRLSPEGDIGRCR